VKKPCEETRSTKPLNQITPNRSMETRIMTFL
jgi:hypothetical protein